MNAYAMLFVCICNDFLTIVIDFSCVLNTKFLKLLSVNRLAALKHRQFVTLVDKQHQLYVSVFQKSLHSWS